MQPEALGIHPSRSSPIHPPKDDLIITPGLCRNEQRQSRNEAEERALLRFWLCGPAERRRKCKSSKSRQSAGDRRSKVTTAVLAKSPGADRPNREAAVHYIGIAYRLRASLTVPRGVHVGTTMVVTRASRRLPGRVRLSYTGVGAARTKGVVTYRKMYANSRDCPCEWEFLHNEIRIIEQ